MESEMLTNKRMAIAVVLAQLALLTILLVYPNLFIAIIALLSFVIAASVWRFGYLLKPIITRHAAVVEGFGRYEIPSSQDIIVKSQGDRYFATSYLLIRFAQSAIEKTPEQISLMKQGYERTLSSLRCACKISNMVCPVDLSGHSERIKESRSKAESRLSELESLPPSANSGAEITHLKREIESCSTQLERIMAGDRPMRMLNFAMTCASDRSMDAAMAKARAQAAELKAVLSGTLDCEVTVLAGDELKRCFEWEHMLPEDDGYLY